MLWDTHMHCRFSGDSEADPVDMIEAARTAGLDGICFTDHLDYDFPSDPPDLFVLDLETYEQAIPALDGMLKGFADPEALLTAPETRSSSPVRILRGESLQSAVHGLYPCGEGAGYAGGILSAAVDGMLCAEAVLRDTV